MNIDDIIHKVETELESPNNLYDNKVLEEFHEMVVTLNKTKIYINHFELLMNNEVTESEFLTGLLTDFIK